MTMQEDLTSLESNRRRLQNADDCAQFVEELYPICRSITGNGLRETLRRIQQFIPIQLREVASGTQVFDWQVPSEWNIRDAFVELDGQRIIDFQKHNLHVLNYSRPIDARLSWQELRPHIHSLPDQPELIPYRTQYYSEGWGFCCAHRLVQKMDQLASQRNLEFRVVIESELNPSGSLTYGELLIPGESSDEFLFSAHVCHPSLANDNLAAVAIATRLAQQLLTQKRKLSYRFLFAPGTIGTIAYLAQNPYARTRIQHGLVLALLGNGQPFIYKATRSEQSTLDFIVQQTLADRTLKVMPPEPFGYDERQYATSGIDLPVGRLSRSREGQFPEYHTSADNLEFVQSATLDSSYAAVVDVIDALEAERFFENCSGPAELQLGKRNLYPIADELLDASMQPCKADIQKAIGWILSWCDGKVGLAELSLRSGITQSLLAQATDILVAKGLIREVTASPGRYEHGVPSPESRARSARAHELIPGGAHTYAKGDDQFPTSAPRFFERGQGCYAFDTDGNRFVEYGIGLRSVGLGHAYPEVVEAASKQMLKGANFTRPAAIELDLAEQFLDLLPAADMIKFTKNGSDATTAAIRLARAQTGRSGVLVCRDQPFFSVDDWFIGTTAMDAGIPDGAKRDIVGFPYNDLSAIERMFAERPDSYACLIMEACTYTEPEAGYLLKVQELCRQHGTLFVLDEMITGFRWNVGGAQAEYGLTPDLSTFGKAVGNGFSVAALAGKREHMELGGLDHDRSRVFLLSYTHGAETHCLAAAQATIATYQHKPVIETLYRQGTRLKDELTKIAEELGIERHFYLMGRGCNLIYVTEDPQGRRSQQFRTMLLEQLISRGVFSPSLVVSYAHDDDAIDATLEAFAESLKVYRRALEDGVEKFLQDRPSKPVFRKFN